MFKELEIQYRSRFVGARLLFYKGIKLTITVYRGVTYKKKD